MDQTENTISMEHIQRVIGALYLENRLQAELIASLKEEVARLQVPPSAQVETESINTAHPIIGETFTESYPTR